MAKLGALGKMGCDKGGGSAAGAASVSPGSLALPVGRDKGPHRGGIGACAGLAGGTRDGRCFGYLDLSLRGVPSTESCASARVRAPIAQNPTGLSPIAQNPTGFSPGF